MTDVAVRSFRRLLQDVAEKPEWFTAVGADLRVRPYNNAGRLLAMAK